MSVPQGAFLSPSVYLSGFSKVELTATGMLDEYFHFFLEKVSPPQQLRLWTFAESIERFANSDDETGINTEVQRVLLNNLA